MCGYPAITWHVLDPASDGFPAIGPSARAAGFGLKDTGAKTTNGSERQCYRFGTVLFVGVHCRSLVFTVVR
jgi:hypothetical protein